MAGAGPRTAPLPHSQTQECGGGSQLSASTEDSWSSAPKPRGLTGCSVLGGLLAAACAMLGRWVEARGGSWHILSKASNRHLSGVPSFVHGGRAARNTRASNWGGSWGVGGRDPETLNFPAGGGWRYFRVSLLPGLRARLQSPSGCPRLHPLPHLGFPRLRPLPLVLIQN